MMNPHRDEAVGSSTFSPRGIDRIFISLPRPECFVHAGRYRAGRCSKLWAFFNPDPPEVAKKPAAE
jgi:hypothetical protein